MRRRTVTTRAVAALAVLAALAGCSASEAEPPAPASSTDAAASAAPTKDAATGPAVGDCWQLASSTEAETWHTWEGGASVDCATEHTLLTYAVGELPDEPYPTENAEGRLEFSDTVSAALRDACMSQFDTGTYLGSRVRTYWFFSTPKQWAAGDRSVRCDVAVLALGPTTPAGLEPLTVQSLDDAMAAAHTTYAACVNTAVDRSTDGPGAGWDEGSYVDCAGPHQWEFGGAYDMTEPAFPGAEATEAQARAYCEGLNAQRGTEQWWAYWPDQELWDSGDVQVQCWLSPQY